VLKIVLRYRVCKIHSVLGHIFMQSYCDSILKYFWTNSFISWTECISKSVFQQVLTAT